MSDNQLVTKQNGGLQQAGVNKDFLQTLIDSKKLPMHIKTVEEAITVAHMGKELGFPTMQAFHYIIPIQGRLTLSAKAIGAVLRSRGVKFKTLNDGDLIYKNGTTKPDSAEEKPIDRKTTILFRRDGWDEEVSFFWTDAVKMGLTTKDNWVRMPKEMLYARCLAKGANRVGQDLLLGLYSTDEMYDSLEGLSEDNVKRDDDGTILEILQ